MPPVVALYGSELTPNAGDDVTLTCNVYKGDTPSSISWTYHGAELPLNRRFTTMPAGDRTSLLLIRKVAHGHSGTYTCLARNKAGVESQAVELVVKGQSLCDSN